MAAKPAPRKPSHRPVPLAASHCRDHRAPDCPPVGGHLAIRQISTVRTVGSPDYKELFDVNGAGFEWLGETDTRSQTNTPDLAEVAPTFGMASAKPQTSEESLDDLFFDVENWLIMLCS